ncbi:hypothetical protein BDZ45DRAFT_778447 [Acephala macrosclerotiorum]|nr:hypothetical protein BDZ45DRAFT_778447 [Acephala macrosclerotiorum]
MSTLKTLAAHFAATRQQNTAVDAAIDAFGNLNMNRELPILGTQTHNTTTLAAHTSQDTSFDDLVAAFRNMKPINPITAKERRNRRRESKYQQGHKKVRIEENYKMKKNISNGMRKTQAIVRAHKATLKDKRKRNPEYHPNLDEDPEFAVLVCFTSNGDAVIRKAVAEKIISLFGLAISTAWSWNFIKEASRYAKKLEIQKTYHTTDFCRVAFGSEETMWHLLERLDEEELEGRELKGVGWRVVRYVPTWRRIREGVGGFQWE